MPDIASQLFPNPLTMLIQLCSTGVLFFFVKKYLWGPARQMLETRAEHMQEDLTKAQTVRLEAEAESEKVKAELKEAAELSRKIVENAKVESLKVKETIVEEAKKEAEHKLESARREIEYEKKQMRQEMTQEIIEVAFAATEKLIESKANKNEDQAAIERFVSAVRKS